MPRGTLPGDPKAKVRSATETTALTALETKAQQFTNPKFWALVLLLLLVALNGCVCVDLTAPPASRLRKHPKRVVQYPAKAGRAVGMVVGIPLSIVLCPVTVPYIYLATEGGDQDGLFVILPLVISSNVGTICVGGPPWLLFGWWGRTEPVEGPRPVEPEGIQVAPEDRLSGFKVPDVRKNYSVSLPKHQGPIRSLSVDGVGSIDGAAEIALIMNGQPYKTEKLSGGVSFRWTVDWPSGRVKIRYTPASVTAGSLILMHKFSRESAGGVQTQ